MRLHIGFTGTRHGMSKEQMLGVAQIIDETNVFGLISFADMTGRHGLCVGADEDFHAICRQRQIAVIGHPGPDWPDGKLCAYTICGNTLEPMPHMKRNAAIVAASAIMIATPLESEPQALGGTWKTIGMARKALKRGVLERLHVVGRNGDMLDHSVWP